MIGYDANALYLWAIAQEMPTGKHEHVKTYDLNQLKKDILNNDLLGFLQVDIETPENLIFFLFRNDPNIEKFRDKKR